ncbi:unnamed protein product [Schistosoma turkestanicum]|nr:unnamed protein product [Schistosoma turkestanicum]
MIQNNEKLSEYSSCTTVKPVEKPVFMNNPSPHKIATQPIDNFKFGYSAQNLENSEKLKAFSSIIVDNSDHDQKVHSTKDIQFSFDTFGKLPIQGKQSESSVRGESLLQTNHEPQFKLSSQSEVINSYSDFKGFKPSTVTSVDSSYEQSQLLDSINFKFSCTASNTAVSDNPLFSNVFERNNALFSPSNPSNSTGLNTITSISLNFPNQQETGAFNFNSAFQMTKDVMLSTTSPQFSNHDAPVNNEIRKKVQAVRRLRR